MDGRTKKHGKHARTETAPASPRTTERREEDESDSAPLSVPSVQQEASTRSNVARGSGTAAAPSQTNSKRNNNSCFYLHVRGLADVVMQTNDLKVGLAQFVVKVANDAIDPRIRLVGRVVAIPPRTPTNLKIRLYGLKEQILGELVDTFNQDDWVVFSLSSSDAPRESWSHVGSVGCVDRHYYIAQKKDAPPSYQDSPRVVLSPADREKTKLSSKATPI